MVSITLQRKITSTVFFFSLSIQIFFLLCFSCCINSCQKYLNEMKSQWSVFLGLKYRQSEHHYGSDVYLKNTIQYYESPR